MNATAQTPPADELYAVRLQQKALEQREAELKRLILSDPSARTGNLFIAEIRETETSRTDIKEMRANHPDIVKQFTFPAKVTRVELAAISEDGEIVSLRRKPTLRTMRVV